MIKKISIGSVEINNNIFLAPMAGVTDKSFRVICRGHGCGLAYSEMVSVKSIVYNNIHTKRLLESGGCERPFAAQLFGHEPEAFAEAVKRLDGLTDGGIDIIDINMGCPVPKIVKNGEGCALMNDPPLAGRIIEAAARASARPVTVKIRKGFSSCKKANAAEMARVARESGAAAVTVHGRTRDQFYAGSADWDCIAEVKRAVEIPIIGNGDIFTPSDAARMFKHTGCDAVMVARGAMGNPWIFGRIIDFLNTGTILPPPTMDEKRETALRHLRMVIAHKGEQTGLLEMRKHFSWYVKGFESASLIRQKINTARTAGEIAAILGFM